MLVRVPITLKNPGFTLKIIHPQHQFNSRKCCFPYFLRRLGFILRQKMCLADIEVFVASRWNRFQTPKKRLSLCAFSRLLVTSLLSDFVVSNDRSVLILTVIVKLMAISNIYLMSNVQITVKVKVLGLNLHKYTRQIWAHIILNSPAALP